MAKGGAREGAGRKLGGKNKKTTLDRLLERFPDCDPLMKMAELASDEAKITKDGIEVLKVDDTLRFQCYKELTKYCYPTLRSVELTGGDGGPVEVIQTYILPDGTKLEFK